MTEAEARVELMKEPLEDLKKMAEEKGLNIFGLDKVGIVERLLGNCAGCKGDKKGNATVVYIPAAISTAARVVPPKPCIGCK